MVKDFESIKSVAYTFVKELYTAPENPPLDFQAYPFDLIPHRDHESINAMLMASISMDELKKALDGMEPDKAPGPDGFNARFFSNLLVYYQ